VKLLRQQHTASQNQQHKGVLQKQQRDTRLPLWDQQHSMRQPPASQHKVVWQEQQRKLCQQQLTTAATA
jgi:hypothetical protein